MSASVRGILIIGGILYTSCNCTSKRQLANMASARICQMPGVEGVGDEKLDSSLLILMKAFRLGGNRAAESAAKQQLVHWTGTMTTVEIAVTDADAVQGIKEWLNCEGARNVASFGLAVFADARLGIIDEASRSDKVWSIAMSQEAQ